MRDPLIFELRLGLDREMAAVRWGRGTAGPGRGPLAIAEYLLPLDEGLIGSATFGVARWQTVHVPGQEVRYEPRDPLTIGTVIRVECPDAGRLVERAGGESGVPSVERPLPRVRVAPGSEAARLAAAQLAGNAELFGRLFAKRYGTTKALIARLASDREVSPATRREWIPAVLAASGQRERAGAILGQYEKAAGRGAADERYRAFATELRRAGVV